MKRNELKRGTSQLKRTPMKKRTKRHRDTPASLGVRKQYRDANQCCEVEAFLAEIKGWKPTFTDALEVHHLAGGSGRVDVVSNLLVVSHINHSWIEGNPVDGRIVCAFVKWKKGELDAENYRELFGQSLAGWLEYHEPHDMRLRPAWLELLQSLSDPISPTDVETA
jgi:hypothetical protein